MTRDWYERERAGRLRSFEEAVARDPTSQMAQLSARLKAANAGLPKRDYSHLFDPDRAAKLWLRMGGGHVPVLDTSEDAEPVRPMRKRRPAGIARQATLPPTLAPRLISRDAAAAYVGVSPNTFDKMIADGLMPRPRQLTERRLAWDLRQLDAAIDRGPSTAMPTPTQPMMITVGMT